MAFSGSSFTPNPLAHFSDIKTRRLLPFQIRCQGKSESETPKKLSFSRRDAIIGLTALSSSAIGISSPEIAEARISKTEMRRKIKEKLDLLREKAGLSKKNECDNGKLPSPPPPAKKENNLLLQPSPLPLPEPPLGRNRSLVEATHDP